MEVKDRAGHTVFIVVTARRVRGVSAKVPYSIPPTPSAPRHQHCYTPASSVEMPTKRPRQEPVSCQRCRAKKLRCDRQQPCANCSARGVSCESSAPAAQSPSGHDDPAVLTRLKHLEDAVESLRKTVLPQPAATSSIASLGSEIPKATGALDHDCQPTNRRSIGLELLPVGRMRNSKGTRMCLPAKHEAVGLFCHYNNHVNYLHHVIHAPSALALIDQVYSLPLEEAEPAYAALLLGMLACASYFWNPTVGVFTAQEDAQHASSLWLEAAHQMLQHARGRSAAVCLEEVQATIIVSYLAYNVEGFSPRVRLGNAAAVTLARDLSLHKLDGPLQPGPRESPVQREVKRRVWWQVVSLDWLLAFLPGPQEGTYLVQPRHMAVNLPQDTDDQHLEQGLPHPPSQPSTMSYFLQRVRLAELCRNIADSTTELPFDLRQTDSSTLRALDGQFEHFFATLPPYFRLDDDPQNAQAEFPHTTTSTPRYLIHLGAQTRRSKLHQPWLVRGLHEPQFAFARAACLSSSRTVLHVARLLEDDGKSRPFAPARLCAVVHHVATAAVILVADLSCAARARGATAEEEEQRKLEIVGACQMLERVSAVAESFLASLNAVLRRHGIQLPYSVRLGAPEESSSPAIGGGAALPGVETLASGGPEEEEEEEEVGPFDALLRSGMDMGFDLDVPAWDELFTDLNACPAFHTDLLDFSL